MIDVSKFVLVFNDSATEVNRQPNLRGEYRLAGESATQHLALWGGVSKNDRLYARGKAIPASASDAIRARAASDDVALPPGIDLKPGEAALFENAGATVENRQPKYYGYAREADRIVRLKGWERGRVITGVAEAYRPDVKGAVADEKGPDGAR